MANPAIQASLPSDNRGMSPDPMTTMNISLPQELKAFVDERMRGRFSSASEYIRELLRQDQRRASQVRLDDLLVEGMDSGEPIETSEAYWSKKRMRLNAPPE